MKKIFLVVAIIATLCLTGCGTLSDKDIKNDFIKETENLKSYYMEGTLKITNNDDTYEYDVKTSYKKDNHYKVSLTNKANNYEQIILKNDEAVYVITPSINKSFKFQSDWPNNNSQSYLLDSVAKDLKNDEKAAFTQKDKDYIFTVETNYPNNPKYVKQNIILDKNKNLKKVEVQDEEGITYVEFKVTTLDKKATFKDTAFNLEEITKDFKETEENSQKNSEESNQNTNNQPDENNNQNKEQNNEQENNENNTQNQTENNTEETNQNQTEETSKLDENIFPLYLPSNTTLSDKEVISTKDGERIIMTFSGDNPFILVQETVKPQEELEIIPTYGEPFMLIDTVGSLTDTSYTWTSSGVEYYIVSEQMDKKELLEVAKSINVVSTLNTK